MDSTSTLLLKSKISSYLNPKFQAFCGCSGRLVSDLVKNQKTRFLKAHIDNKLDTPEETILNNMENLPHFYETKKKKTSGVLKQETKKLLVDFYQPQIEELAKMLGDEKFRWKDGSFS